MRDIPRYAPEMIEGKWQKHWLESGVLNASDDHSMPKFYPLIEFPYPSAHGLHVGHPRSNTAMDIIARKRRMEGYNVLFPMGYDAFGLPTENFAIKKHIHRKQFDLSLSGDNGRPHFPWRRSNIPVSRHP